jgi:hypothetical protein
LDVGFLRRNCCISLRVTCDISRFSIMPTSSFSIHAGSSTPYTSNTKWRFSVDFAFVTVGSPSDEGTGSTVCNLPRKAGVVGVVVSLTAGEEEVDDPCVKGLAPEVEGVRMSLIRLIKYFPWLEDSSYILQ